MSGFVGLFCWFVFAGDGDAMHDSETNLVWRQLSVRWGLVTHGQVVSDDEVSGLVMMMILKCSILLHKLLVDTLQNIFSVLSRHQLFWRFLVVQDESLCHAEMKAQDWLPWLRVIVDERMNWTCPPVRHHPQPVPELSLIISQLLNDVGERSEDSGTLAGNTDDVVEGVGEGTLLKTTINVPASPANIGASLSPVIGDSEDVTMRRLLMIVECWLYISEPATNSQVNLWSDVLLMFEH